MRKIVAMTAIVFLIFMTNIAIYALSPDMAEKRVDDLKGFQIITLESTYETGMRLIPTTHIRGENDVHLVTYTHTIRLSDTNTYIAFTVMLDTKDGIVPDTTNLIDIDSVVVEQHDGIIVIQTTVSINTPMNPSNRDRLRNVTGFHLVPTISPPNE